MAGTLKIWGEQNYLCVSPMSPERTIACGSRTGWEWVGHSCSMDRKKTPWSCKVRLLRFLLGPVGSGGCCKKLRLTHPSMRLTQWIIGNPALILLSYEVPHRWSLRSVPISDFSLWTLPELRQRGFSFSDLPLGLVGRCLCWSPFIPLPWGFRQQPAG